MNQKNLFDLHREPYTPVIDPHVRPADRPRLSGQNAAILNELRKGPKTNSALSVLSLKYTSRISDLRAAGYTITCERRPGGLTVYTLEE